MITFNLKSSIVLLALGFVIGFCLSFLFNGYGSDPAVSHQKVITTEELKKQAAQNEASYQKKIVELETRSHELQTALKTTTEQLTLAKVKTKQRESSIKKIVEPKGLPARQLLEKVKPATFTESGQAACDSLAREVNEYIQENVLKDSLYESQINTLDSMVTLKDSVIRLKTQLYNETMNVFAKSLAQQEILQNENRQLRKAFKRQKRKGRLAAVGLVILSGFAANYLLNH